jgi:hypothetical protein
MDEVVFDSEEVLFSFEGNNYSAMVDFYGEEEWKIQSLCDMEWGRKAVG